MHPNAKIRQRVLEVLYLRREQDAGRSIRDGWTDVAEIKQAVTEIDFALSVLVEVGHIQRDGFRYRITGAGALAAESASTV